MASGQYCGTISVVKVSPEDLFFENLTLGLTKILSTYPRISNVTVERRQSCEKQVLTNWEQRHNVSLPDDMKRFYLSNDGFLLHWHYQYSPIDIRRVGCINIPHLQQIDLLKENIELFLSKEPSAPRHNNDESLCEPNLNPRSKIFEINSILDLAKICLVYEASDSTNPKIYALESGSLKFRFLSNSFSGYLRMAIAHMGLPYWELCFTNCNLPSWTEQLFLLLAPHLLEKSESYNRSNATYHKSAVPTFNAIDPSVFRVKPKCLRTMGSKQK